MNKTQHFIKELAVKYNLDVRVVNEIVNHPLHFTKAKMASNDLNPIRIRHLGAFVQRITNSKYNICDRNVRTMLFTYEQMAASSILLNVHIDAVDKVLYGLLHNGKYVEINDLYTRFHKVIKNLVKAPKLNNKNNSSIN